MKGKVYNKTTKKIIIYVITISILIANFTFVNNVNATVEDGNFRTNELPYNLQIVKVETRKNIVAGYSPAYSYTLGYDLRNVMLDSEGRLWITTTNGINRYMPNYTFSDVACGVRHCIALDKDGYLLAWGDNRYGQLGNGTFDNANEPVEIMPTKKFKKVYCNENTSYAIDEKGKIYSWGSNKYEEAQTYNYENKIITETTNVTNRINVQNIPKNILEEHTFEMISACNGGTLALDTKGYVWGWGYNKYGQVGNKENDTIVTSPGLIGEIEYIATATKVSETKFKDISKGISHSILLTVDGKAYTMGSANHMQYEEVNLPSTPTLYQPIGFEDIEIKDVIAGKSFSAFIDKDNNVWTCGANNNGTLGNGTKTDSNTIVRVKQTNDKELTSFPSTNCDQSIFALDINNNLWSWGYAYVGQLGSGTSYNNTNGDREGEGNYNKIQTVPIQVTGIKQEYKVTFMDGTQTIGEQTVKKGESATAPTLTKPGYTYIWDTDFSNVTQDLTIRAIWTANTNTPYTVEHYLRTTDTEAENYEKETEEKQGTTDSTAIATPKTYKGFTENASHPNRVPTGTITADGNLVLKLYYDRNTYNITYELNGGTPSGTLLNSYTYGKETYLSNKVTKPGYNFAGWYDNSNCTGTPITSIPAGETGNKTVYAKWVNEELYYITSEKYSINEEENYITKVSPNTTATDFINNITTNETKKLVNQNGEEVTGSTLVGTGYKLQVTYKGNTYEYEIAVRGDLDGNGRITITDLSILNQILVRKLTVTGTREKAADLDYSGKISITDLSMMNQVITKRITL